LPLSFSLKRENAYKFKGASSQTFSILYTLENIKFSHFTKDNIFWINNKTYTFDDTEDKFLIIKWKSYENIQITYHGYRNRRLQLSEPKPPLCGNTCCF